MAMRPGLNGDALKSIPGDQFSHRGGRINPKKGGCSPWCGQVPRPSGRACWHDRTQPAQIAYRRISPRSQGCTLGWRSELTPSCLFLRWVVPIGTPAMCPLRGPSQQIDRQEQRAPLLELRHMHPLMHAKALQLPCVSANDDVAEGDGSGRRSTALQRWHNRCCHLLPTHALIAKGMPVQPEVLQTASWHRPPIHTVAAARAIAQRPSDLPAR